MKKSILYISLIIASLTLGLYSCKKSNLEESSLSTRQNSTKQDKTLFSNISPTYEIEYYNFLISSINSIKQGSFDSIQINNLVNYSNANYTVQLDANEQSIVFDFFQNQELNLLTLDNFKTYISNNVNYQTANLSKFIALTKVSIQVYKEAFDNPSAPNVGEFENCLNNCIDNKLGDIFDRGNIVDKTLFIAGIPESFLAIVASCSYDCFKSNRQVSANY